jgi:HTH-type transcriptional regulator/antitoxin HigA
MDATLILIDSDAELARARAMVDRLWQSDKPADIARLQAQARLIAAYEEAKWPRRPPSTADLIRHLMEHHVLTRRTWCRSWERRAGSARSCRERRG